MQLNTMKQMLLIKKLQVTWYKGQCLPNGKQGTVFTPGSLAVS